MSSRLRQMIYYPKKCYVLAFSLLASPPATIRMTKLNYIKIETNKKYSSNPITVVFHCKFYTCSIPSSQLHGPCYACKWTSEKCTIHQRLSFSIHFFGSALLVFSPLSLALSLNSCVASVVQRRSRSEKKLYSLTFLLCAAHANEYNFLRFEC